MMERAGAAVTEADLAEAGVRASLLELVTIDDCSEELRQAVSVLSDCVQATRLVDPAAASRGSLPNALEALSAELAKVDQRRDALVRGLPTTQANRLTALRERSVYPRICGMFQGRCAACNAELPPVLADALKQGRGDYCPSCKRVLVS